MQHPPLLSEKQTRRLEGGLLRELQALTTSLFKLFSRRILENIMSTRHGLVRVLPPKSSRQILKPPRLPALEIRIDHENR